MAALAGDVVIEPRPDRLLSVARHVVADSRRSGSERHGGQDQSRRGEVSGSETYQ